MLPKTSTAIDQVIRTATTAGELAAHEGMFNAFVKKGARVSSIRYEHRSRPTIGWVDKEFLAWEKDHSIRDVLLTLRFAIETAKKLPPETPIDKIFWETVEDAKRSL
jgi:hypothetical protein